MNALLWSVVLPLLCVSCAPPAPSARCPPTSPATASNAPANASADETRRYYVTLTPTRAPAPHVHVAIEAAGVDVGSLRLVSGQQSSLTGLVARDARGALDLALDSDGAGPRVRAARVPEGVVRVEYDLAATGDPRAPTGDVVVGEDRFRAPGERLVLVPDEGAPADLRVTIDGADLAAPDAASSLGVGRQRSRFARPAALARAAFVAGSLGRAAFESSTEHDEAAWLGYTDFDPRPAAAEIAQVREALREQWKGGGDDAFTTLFVSTPRPRGAFTTVPRAGSLLVHLGPSEPWSAALRVAITQQLMRTWVGGELRLVTAPSDPEASQAWFGEGVARYLAATVLRRLGLLSVDDASDFAAGLLALSPAELRRGERRIDLAREAIADPSARAALVARGALYALSVATRLRARRAETTLTSLTLALLVRAREAKAPLPEGAFVDALAVALGADEPARFTSLVERGLPEPPAPSALGPCFRVAPGQHPSFALGFDPVATSETAGHLLSTLDPRGPAAAAGARPTDTLDDAQYRDHDPGSPVTLALRREGAALTLHYAPRGESYRAPRVTRTRHGHDESCGDVL